MPVLEKTVRENLLKQLDILTQQQTYFAKINRPDKYLALETPLKELLYQIFDGEEADFYYATSLFDSCALLAGSHYLTEAKAYQQKGLALLFTLFGTCPYYHFINAIFTAKIAFYMEDYYICIEEATKANQHWYR